MKPASRLIAVILFFLFSFLVAAQTQSSDTELNLGVTERRGARWEEAVQHFQRVTELDPSNFQGSPVLGHRLGCSVHSRSGDSG